MDLPVVPIISSGPASQIDTNEESPYPRFDKGANMARSRVQAAPSNDNTDQNRSDVGTEPSADFAESSEEVETPGTPTAEPAEPTLLDVIRFGSDFQVRERIISETSRLFSAYQDVVDLYCVVVLYDINDSISSWHSNQIYESLSTCNKDKSKDIMLMIVSSGGSVEPAYQISKLCKEYSKERFVVVVPRQAKSAATLIALGADEIHMGPLGELGPIDPQVGKLPALGVVQALERIAALAQSFPGSSDMFSKYLKEAVTVEQIGYCERISESATQYAERLINTKFALIERSKDISRKLVYEYKDHGFVIDSEEATNLLNRDIIIRDSPELMFAESYYRILDYFSLFLGFYKSKEIRIIGSADRGIWVWDKPRGR